MTEKIKQNLPNAILDADLEYIEVLDTRENFVLASRWFMKIANKLELNYDDLLISLGLKQRKINKDTKEKIAQWEASTDEERSLLELDETFTKYLEQIKELEKDINAKDELLSNFTLRLGDYLINECHDILGKPRKEMLELIDILKKSLRLEDPDLIDNTSVYILGELFLRIFFKPKRSLENAFFLNLTSKVFIAILKQLNFIKTES